MYEKIKFDDLTKPEQNILTQTYGSQSGYNLKKILYVQELNEAEKVFLTVAGIAVDLKKICEN